MLRVEMGMDGRDCQVLRVGVGGRDCCVACRDGWEGP